MHRVDADGHVANQFTDGNPGLGQPATLLAADWHNAIQEELCKIVEESGTALNKPTNTQLNTALGILFGVQVPPGGRLTLEAGVAISPGDVAGAATVRYTPHLHDKVRLYDGTRWKWFTFAELSQTTADATKSPAAVANNSNYDVFVWNDAGTVRATRGPAWTGDGTRGAGAGTTELEYFEGRWVNKVAITNGPLARRGLYVGTIRSDGSAQINDTLTKRHVWNTYNRVRREAYVFDGVGGTYTYTTAAFRQARANAAHQLDFVRGLAEEPVEAEAVSIARNSNAGVRFAVSIGMGGANDNAVLATPGTCSLVDTQYAATAKYVGPGSTIGRFFLVWAEWSQATGTTTWESDVVVGMKPGLRATFWA